MESATLTRPRPGASLRARLRAVPLATLERVGLRLLAIGAAVGIVLAAPDRSLALPAPGLLIFAAFAPVGWTALPARHRLRRPWAAASIARVPVGGTWAVTRFSPDRIDRELTGRERIRDALAGVPTAPAVQRARSCGPVPVPTHELLPDTRRTPGAGVDGVLARDQLAGHGRNTGGVHVYLWGESMLRNTADGPSGSWVQEPPPILVPGDDAQGVARTEGLAAHASR